MDEPSVLTRWLRAGDSGDVEAFDDLLHGDVVVHAPRGLSTEDLEQEKQVWRDALQAMPDLRHEVQEVVVQGNLEMAVSSSPGPSATTLPASREPGDPSVWTRPSSATFANER